jgi:hypothetical protein
MQYALLIYGDDKVWAAQDRAETMAAHEKFGKMLVERNAMRGGKELAPVRDAVTIRHAGEDVSVTEGPYAEAAEVLGGYYVIDAADLDEAIALAKELPEGVVEIRPLVVMQEGGN